MDNAGACVCLGRKALPDLKDTLVRKIRDHLEGVLVEGKDYRFRESTGNFRFKNGSEIICRSWSDKRYTKARSLELSMLVIEELTENNNDEFDGFYKEYRARVGRLPHIKENIVIAATNPDAPSHRAFEYFLEKGNLYYSDGVTVKGKIKTRHVYFSVTTDNPFLPDWYITQLLETYTKQEARRMIYGEWVELKTEVIYYAFSEALSCIDEYKVDPNYPIVISYDFNIGKGKPMSVTFRQLIDGVYYFFDEIVIHGTRTEDTLDEAFGQGLLHHPTEYIIRGDATGARNDTRTKQTDYTIIENFLSNCPNLLGSTGINFKKDVPFSNPPVRTRHIRVNGLLCNALGKTSVKIVKNKCPMLVKGFRLARLVDGGQYIENDKDEFQHVTTAAGYDMMRQIDNDTLEKRCRIS